MVQRQIRLGLKFATRLDTLLDEHKDEIALPSAAAQEFVQASYAFLGLLTALGHHFHPDGILLFHVTIKAHYIAHIAEMTRYISPRLTWCYTSKDFINKVKKLAQATHKGTPPALVVPKVMRQYCQGLSFNLLGSDVWRL